MPAQVLRHRVRAVSVIRAGVPETEEREVEDLVAVEEPLEIRIGGETVGVLMRTPGDDHRLALGFLLAEGIITSAQDVSAVFHCGRPGSPGFGNTIEVSPASRARIDWERLDGTRRVSAASSACGVCGRSAVDDLIAGLPPPSPVQPVAAAEIRAAIEALREHQPAFGASGGTHVAALFARGGALIAAHEDVGRHNAVDKVVGALLQAQETASAGARPEPALLAVSSRAGLEVLQKAARARIPVVAAVSAPTSLAVDLARSAGLALCGFVRGRRMNVYAGADRITGLEAA